MSRPRIAVITAACVLPLLLAMANFDYTVWVWIIGDDGRHNSAGHYDVEDPSVTGDYNFGCNQGMSNCDWCSDCHVGGEGRQGKGYTSDKHLKDYYPRARLSLSEGQRLSWGQSGGYLTSQRGRLEYHLKDGTLDLVAPPGSLILKDRSGRPFLLYFAGKPTLQPKRP
jgi:hypothetical protein